MTITPGKEHLKKGLHIVSIVEGVKGLLVLVVGFGLLEFIRRKTFIWQQSKLSRAST